MFRGIHNLGRTLALVTLGSSLLLAQEKGIGADFKLRAGYGLSTNDNLNSTLLGLGLNLRYGFDWGTLNAELGYSYKPGSQFLVGFDAPAAGKSAADPANSVDSRKNSLDQVNARFSYERAIDKSWSWQAGLQVGKSRFRHEYVGEVAGVDLVDPTLKYRDTYNGTPTKSVLTVSPFVGVSYQINGDSAFELNLLSLSYTAINFRHTPGAALAPGSPTGAGAHLVYVGDHLDEQKRNAIHVEIGYTFRF
jgi:hypothetical protein